VGNIDVGNKTPRHLGQPMAARADGELRIEAPNTVRMKRPGAMSQQCGDSGNYSTPQKLVQLVGCRDPKVRAEPWVRPGVPFGPAKP
jgi:hypothetical protein